MKKVMFMASECVPFIKTGGLADVAGALPKCFDKKYFVSFQDRNDKHAQHLLITNYKIGD